MKFHLLTDEEIELRKQDYVDFYGLSTYEREPDERRCPHCGRYKKRGGHCSLEVPVERGWLWEHR